MKQFNIDWPIVLTVTGSIIGFLLFDLVAPQFFQGMTFGMAVIGCCIGQLNLIATWAALARGHVAFRVPWAMLLAAFMWFALIVGNNMTDYPIRRYEAVLLGSMLLFGVVMAQIPLWVARLAFGWRLQRDTHSAESTTRDNQFNLKHLLVGMLLLSLALAPARALLPEGELTNEFGPAISQIVGIMFTLAFFNLTLSVPAIWGASLPWEKLVAVAVGWLIYCLLLTLAEYGIVSMIFGPSPDDGEAVIALYLLNAVQSATVLLGLLALRLAGYRMIRRTKDSLPTASPPAR